MSWTDTTRWWHWAGFGASMLCLACLFTYPQRIPVQWAVVTIAVAGTLVSSRSSHTQGLAAFSAVLLFFPITYLVAEVVLAWGFGTLANILLTPGMIWSQVVFGAALYWRHGDAVLSQRWGGVVSVAVWTLVAFLFALVFRNRSSFAALLGLAFLTLVGVLCLVTVALPVKWSLSWP